MAVQEAQQVFFKISIGKADAGRIVFRLYPDVPRTTANFAKLCENKRETGLSYQGSKFHRIIPNFMLQGGDFTNHNGTGGKSIYGERFNDENFIHTHDKPYLLSMANAGVNTNGSQFFITTVATPWLNGKHVVFGEVIEGQELIKTIEGLGSQSGSPSKEVVITDCGIHY